MDDQAENYNSDATISNGTCVYCPQPSEVENHLVITTTAAQAAESATGNATFNLDDEFVKKFTTS